MKRRILVVDDDRALSRTIALLLEGAGHAVATAGRVEEARAALSGGRFDLVITDLNLPGGTGLDVVTLTRERHPDTPVVVLTAYATVSTAVEAMKLGAYDYLTKPYENERLLQVTSNALGVAELRQENRRLRSEIQARYGLEAIVGTSAALTRVRELVRLAASADAAVMIHGETGTGKELVARAIHAIGRRAPGPFVAVNCGAIPDSLVESELFGHHKGSFTGAIADRDGRFRAADTGTLFLDEITEMKRDLQVKLLRAIETREVQPVGASEPIRVDVRIISATNRDPGECVRSGGLREDLFYRLNVFTISLPPLREHPEDIPAIAAAYLKRRGYGAELISEEALQLLAAHDFPGNVRELQNVLESGLILSAGRQVRPEHVAERLMHGPAGSDQTENQTLAEIERAALQTAIHQARGNQSRAARLLGISRATLLYRMKRHGLV